MTLLSFPDDYTHIATISPHAGLIVDKTKQPMRQLSCFLIIAISLSLATGSVSAQSAPQSFRSDFRLLRDTLEKLHPSLYRYHSKEYMDRLFDSCERSISDTMTVSSFFTLASYAVTAIGDGHANVRLPKPLLNDYLTKTDLFPAIVMFIHDRAFIYCCKQSPGLDGTELLSIDGRPMNVTINECFLYVPTDGFIRSRKNWEIPEFFPILYQILYGAKVKFTVTCKTPAGAEIQEVLTADRPKNFVCQPPFSRPTRYLELHYTNDTIAILTIRTFYDEFLNTTGESFSRFLDSAFTDIRARGIKKLLIDGRRNQGGNDQNGALLYSYLSDSPFRYYAELRTVKGPLTVDQHPCLALQQPNPLHYDGKVWFLMDGRSFSATAEFAAIARSHKRGLFIGEETGGGYEGNTSGDESMVTLPISQLTCRIPLVRYDLAVQPPSLRGRGIIPDIPVYPDIADLIAHKDSQIDAAIIAIRKNTQ
jgi:hypothetical protein